MKFEDIKWKQLENPIYFYPDGNPNITFSFSYILIKCFPENMLKYILRQSCGEFESLAHVFVWSDTPQGQSFWEHVNNGYYPDDESLVKLILSDNKVEYK